MFSHKGTHLDTGATLVTWGHPNNLSRLHFLVSVRWSLGLQPGTWGTQSFVQ